MNSLFASSVIYSFQTFALTLFLVIHTELAQRGFSSAKRARAIFIIVCFICFVFAR